MSFNTKLLAALGDATDAFDIRATVRRCWFFDFNGYPVRVWHGQGVLTTPDGNEWKGTIDGNGRNHLQVPEVQDSRTGESPKYTFSLSWLDATTWAALKADQDLAKGRAITCYQALIEVGEGLKPATALRHAYELTMQGVEFSDTFEHAGGSVVRNRKAAIFARSLETGRSHTYAGTWTDTAQRERARILGVAADSGCSYVAGLANRTYVIGGDV